MISDIVPSVTAIMRSDNYKQRDHDRTLESFEHRVNVNTTSILYQELKNFSIQ